ncbi:MAG: alginate lyase family protein [Nitrospira sp.]|nr:alginate lyase family protein [Nitrospira sp.]
MISGISASTSTGDDSYFRFLRQAKSHQADQVDWVSKDMPKLWRYNLHYFDYLHDSERSLENKRRLINDWIRHNPPGAEDAWEPYTVSLRIVNWIKFFLTKDCTGSEEHCEELPKVEWIESLHQQALWLEHNIEYHLLANHYLKNGVALLFAGLYFQGVDAERWLRKGTKILRSELQEQFLDDGGHFERSPMYHSICLVDYLDVVNLTQNSQGTIVGDLVHEFRNTVTAALEFLNGICLPDGDIPLFNDSAFGIAPTPRQIFEYAKKVIGYQVPPPSSSVAVNAFPQTGYYVTRKAGDMLVVDCGSIGPDYQPGHAHCDTLSYELTIDGQRVIVDSGVLDYEPSPERAYARSTKAHNTVMIDGEEQSEIWGVFRVARRARPISGQIAKNEHESVLFEGAHDGYMRLNGKPIHKRRLVHDGGQVSWIITDEVAGMGTHRMESFVHFHPDVTLVESGANCFTIERGGETIASIDALHPCQVAIEEGCYFPEFGLSRKNLVLAFACSGELPLQLSYRIQKTTDHDTKATRRANSLPVALFPSGGECPGDENVRTLPAVGERRSPGDGRDLCTESSTRKSL